MDIQASALKDIKKTEIPARVAAAVAGSDEQKLYKALGAVFDHFDSDKDKALSETELKALIDKDVTNADTLSIEDFKALTKPAAVPAGTNANDIRVKREIGFVKSIYKSASDKETTGSNSKVSEFFDFQELKLGNPNYTGTMCVSRDNSLYIILINKETEEVIEYKIPIADDSDKGLTTIGLERLFAEENGTLLGIPGSIVNNDGIIRTTDKDLVVNKRLNLDKSAKSKDQFTAIVLQHFKTDKFGNITIPKSFVGEITRKRASSVKELANKDSKPYTQPLTEQEKTAESLIDILGE
jgi:hypothetical protein